MEYFFLLYIFLYFPKLHLQLWIQAPEVLCPTVLYIWLQQMVIKRKEHIMHLNISIPK